MQHAEEDDALPGQDSFIDVVCNMVGILIVLVVIVGIRATAAKTPPKDAEAAAVRATPASFQSATDESLAALRDAEFEALSAQRDVAEAVERVEDLAAQSLLVDAQRQQLMLLKTTVEQEIAERREKLSEEDRRQFDVQREIAEAEIRLHQLTQEQIAVSSLPANVEKIECVPTPIAKEIDDEEIVYVLLKNKRLAVVPVADLMAEVERRGPDYLRNGLNHRNYAEESFGPVDGFRMRLILARREAGAHIPGTPHDPRAHAAPELQMIAAFTPLSESTGQTVEQALLPDSAFMRALRAKRTATPVVFVWVYGDSYAELRALKRELWKSGTPLALRPVPDGEPIGIATHGGYRAAAQ
ncbi:MAG TPA: hypothetical protein VF175_16290 [Lacipirellula sp.]